MNALVDGFKSAWATAGGAVVAALQLTGIFALAALMFPLFLVGVIAGLAWVALYAGFLSCDAVADWITDGKATWRVQVALKPEGK